jgi:glucose-6-phosphate isomerase, archaeal
MNIDFKNVGKHYAARTHEKMSEVLMDPKGVGPEIHYYMIRGGKDQRNITVWEPGTISGEYIKTYGHYHVGALDETYWIIFGTGIALLQKLALDEKGNMISDVVAEFKVVPVKQGDQVYMPPGYGHLVVNVGMTYFATADDSPVNFGDKKDEASMPGHADYELVKKMQGFAYYVVDNNGKPALKKNPKYKEIQKQDLGGLEVIE